MEDKSKSLTERFIVSSEDADKSCLVGGGIRNLDIVKAEFAVMHSNIMLTYSGDPSCREYLQQLYEKTVTTYDGGNITDLCGELVKDAMGTFHQVATDPKTERMTALYALGYAGQLGRNPDLLQMQDPSPYVDMMMDTVNACAATGRKELRKKAVRMNNGLVYCEELAPYLTGFFVGNSEMMFPATDFDSTKDELRIAAFCHWADVTHDVRGRDELIGNINDRYADLYKEITSYLCEENVPTHMIVQRTIYQGILKPYANAA